MFAPEKSFHLLTGAAKTNELGCDNYHNWKIFNVVPFFGKIVAREFIVSWRLSAKLFPLNCHWGALLYDSLTVLHIIVRPSHNDDFGIMLDGLTGKGIKGIISRIKDLKANLWFRDGDLSPALYRHSRTESNKSSNDVLSEVIMWKRLHGNPLVRNIVSLHSSTAN